jgi:apolipoprotein N-acyltransferase
MLTLSGVMLGLAFPPYGLLPGLLAFVGIVPLLIAIEDSRSLRQTFFRGWYAMFVWGIVANYWVGGWFGIGHVDEFLMMGGAILAVVHPFFLVVPILIYDAVKRRYGSRAALYALPIAWVGFEYWHALGDLSYPWLNLYNTQTYNLAYIQFIEFTGPYGLSLAIIAINVLVFSLLRTRMAAANEWRLSGTGKRNVLIALAALIILPYLHGIIENAREHKSQRTLLLTVVQPNINPWDKWQIESAIMDTNYAVTKRAVARAEAKYHRKPDLLLWPETAITFFITQPRRRAELAEFEQFIDTLGIPVTTGFPDVEEFVHGRDEVPEDAKSSAGTPDISYRTWNSSMLAYEEAPTRQIKLEKYHKQKLVPLGEQVPFLDLLPFLGKWLKWGVGISSWNKGTGVSLQTLPLYDSTTHAVRDSARTWAMICYESVYPSFVRQFVNAGADLFFIITNDGWYGKSAGPYQHNQYAVLRAIENRRWIGRSANTGISGVFDDHGRSIENTPLFEEASVTLPVELNSEKTFYTRFGEYFAIPCMWASVAGVVWLWILRRRDRRAAKLLKSS